MLSNCGKTERRWACHVSKTEAGRDFLMKESSHAVGILQYLKYLGTARAWPLIFNGQLRALIGQRQQTSCSKPYQKRHLFAHLHVPKSPSLGPRTAEGVRNDGNYLLSTVQTGAVKRPVGLADQRECLNIMQRSHDREREGQCSKLQDGRCLEMGKGSSCSHWRMAFPPAGGETKPT